MSGGNTWKIQKLEKRIEWLETTVLVLLSRLSESTLSITPIVPFERMNELINKRPITKDY